MSMRAALAVTKKIRYQIPPGPEAKLLFAIFECAVRDYFDRSELHRRSAATYLTQKTIPHLEILGIDTGWAMGLYKKAGCELSGVRS